MRWVVALVLAAGCASEPPLGSSAAAQLAVPEDGLDARPRVRLGAREAHAVLRYAGGLAHVDLDARLVVAAPDGAERVLGDEVLAAPITDGARLAWAEAHDLGAPALRMDDGVRTVTLAVAPGAMSPLVFLEDGTIAMVGSDSGGVAGLWTIEAREGATPRCVTNCALRAGSPWGDAYVPPPADASIHLEGDTLVFTDADGTRHRSAR